MKGYFLAIGELLADLATIDYCENLEGATTFNLVQGGSPANVAANVKFLGGEAELVSSIGNDGIGRFLISALQKTGIKVAHIQVNPGQPTSVILVTKSKGTPDFIPYRHADACIEGIENSLIENCSIIHTTAFALSKQPAQSSILAAMEKAQSQNKTVSVDWNFAPPIWGVDDGKNVFNKVMQFAPLLKVSVDDVERFRGSSLTIEECKNFLQHFQTTATCLTCGKDGVWFKEMHTAWQFKEAIAVEKVVDVTGAGDAFWAGFIFSFMKDERVANCVQKGLEVAAEKIRKSGPLYG